MKNTIDKLCSDYRHGLYLATVPTGSGKTYSIVHFIHDYLIDESVPMEEKHNICFLTTLKKNIPFEELRSLFEMSGHLDVFQERVIFLDAVAMSVLKGYEPRMDDRILDALGNGKEVTRFLAAVIDLKKGLLEDGSINPLQKEAFSRFAEEIEPAFRRKVRKSIRGSRHSYEDRLGLIEKNRTYSWIAELYPSIHTRRNKVFLMTADKFLMRNDTIIDKSNTIFDSAIVKDAIVFIDEFDSTRNQILKHLVESSIEKRIDFVDLIQKISAGMARANAPNYLYENSKDFTGDLEEEHRMTEDYIRQVLESNHIDRLMKLDESSAGQKAFIFKADITYLVNQTSDTVSIQYDGSENRNHISFGNGDPGSNRALYRILNEIQYAIDRYCRFIAKMAVNHSKREDDSTMSYEDHILTMLDVFGMRDCMPAYRRYLLDKVLLDSPSYRNMENGIDVSIYQKGFGYFVFADDPKYDERTRIDLISCGFTAEKVLLKLCGQALVFGISATAGLGTVLGNYDLEYIRSRLGSRYLGSLDGSASIDEQIERSRAHYDLVDIRTHEVSTEKDGVYDDGLWADIIEDDAHLSRILKLMDGCEKDYDRERYLSISKAFQGFIRNRDSHACLCFCNKHPKENDRNFDISVLKHIFKIIVVENGHLVDDGFSVDESVVQLVGDGYDRKKAEAVSILSQGRKLFVITTYQTVGAGQNLQYRLVDGRTYINVSDLPDRDYTDFDSIYVSLPTHLMESPENPDDDSSKSLEIFKLNFLLMNGEISEREARAGITSVLSFNKGGMSSIMGLVRQTRSAKRFVAGRVIQAMGRICRTNMKNVAVDIYYDEALRGFIDEPLGSYGRVNVETERLISAVSEKRIPAPDIQHMCEKAVHRSHNANLAIREMISVWSIDHIDAYERVREDLLRSPTTDELGNTAYQMYIELPKRSDHYWCRYDGEYSGLQIDFDGTIPGSHMVCADSMKLPQLMRIDGLRELFESKGYATSFSPGRYIVSPPAAKNLLMGIYGEIAGTHILERFNMPLYPLDQRFYERFDAQLSPETAIDFKLWSSESFTDWDEQRDKVLRKMEETGHTTAIIINVLLVDGFRRSSIDTVEGRTIVRIPWLFDPEAGAYNEDGIAEIRRHSI